MTATASIGAVWRFDAIGVPWEIVADGAIPVSARHDVAATIDEFDRFWSRFRADSTVSRLAQVGGDTLAPAHAAVLLAVYAELDTATDGAINPLVARSLAALGYPMIDTALPGPVPASDSWRDHVILDDDRVRIDQGALLDVGACGKGLLVDLVTDVLRVHGVTAVTVDASGDLRVSDREERIALEHPFDLTRAIGVATVRDQALCASAINRRVWGDGLHHVIDARTGLPVRTIAATWAIAPDALHADAAASALFFDGGPALAHDWGVDWVRMRTDGTVEHAPASRIEVFR